MKYAFLLLLIGAAMVQVPATQPVKRDHRVRSEFQRLHPCPATGKRTGPCPGWVVDHVIPLACGGKDAVSNMHWQTVAEAKAKDKWERKNCGASR